jgi:hypothetical protein
MYLLPRIYLRSDPTRAQWRTLRATHARAMRDTKLHWNWRPPTLVNDAIILERAGRSVRADARFAEALALARQHGAALLVSDALYEWARVKAARGDRTGAAACVGEAAAIAKAGGNAWLTSECEKLVGSME